MLSLALALFSQAIAAPGVIPIQGVLTDADGVVIEGDVSVTFRLVSDDTGATSIWQETVTVSAIQGRFAVDLGSGASLDLDTFGNYPDTHLGITVGSDSEMPLVPLDHVPYAAWAENAAALEGHTFSEAQTAILAAADQVFLPQSYAPDWGDLSNIPADISDGDHDTTYGGEDFALSSQSCATGVVTAIDSAGAVMCSDTDWGDLTGVPAEFADGVDNDTTYGGEDFALSSQSCALGDVVTGIDSAGTVECGQPVVQPTNLPLRDVTTVLASSGTYSISCGPDEVPISCGMQKSDTTAGDEDSTGCHVDLSGNACEMWLDVASSVDGIITGHCICMGFG